MLYTQRGVLRDHNAIERGMGINAGLEWMPGAKVSVVYVDRGVSDGMKIGIRTAQAHGLSVEYRSLEGFSVVEKDGNLYFEDLDDVFLPILRPIP